MLNAHKTGWLTSKLTMEVSCGSMSAHGIEFTVRKLRRSVYLPRESSISDFQNIQEHLEDWVLLPIFPVITK